MVAIPVDRFAGIYSIYRDGPAVSEGMTSWSVMSFAIRGQGVFHLRFPSVRYRMDWSSFLLCLTVSMLVSVISHFGAGTFEQVLIAGGNGLPLQWDSCSAYNCSTLLWLYEQWWQ